MGASCHLHEIPTPVCGVSASGLAGMAVGAQRHHVTGMIVPALGQILDVVDIQDRLTASGQLCWHAGAAWILAATAGAHEDRATRGRAARIVGAHDPVGPSRLAPLVNAGDQRSVGGSWLGLGGRHRILINRDRGLFNCRRNLAWPVLGRWPWNSHKAPLQLRPLLDLPPGGGHRGYTAMVDGSGLMVAWRCSHSMGGM
jgi:hypothetical protein